MGHEVWAIVVAAGEGRRFGGPKQFEEFRGRPVLEWSLESARAVADDVVLVLPASAADADAGQYGCSHVVAGGASRSESVRAGLAVIPDQATVVVVHDAVRPLASPALFRAVVDAVLAGADGAVPGIPVADTIKRIDGDLVSETLRRAELVAVQTPQAFALEALRRAHAAGGDATDDAALVEALGGKVRVVPGEAANVKLTAAEDLARLAELVDLEQR